LIANQTPRGGAPVTSISSITSLYQQDAPSCPDCGAIMIRSGACYKCMNCGAVSGCS
jgi:ribonucleoside-diphosphate reductase alpha chain